VEKYKIYTTEEFDKDFEKLDKSEKIEVNKILKQIKERGANVGKPLSGLSFFREKRFGGGKRLYFLIYENFLILLVIAISDKKAQQATINRILLDIEEYQQFILELINKSKN
jgi:putative component of toxin-antitoxin plasmid stabilization module